MSSVVNGRAGLAEELRRRRNRPGLDAGAGGGAGPGLGGDPVLIETGKRRPSLRSWERIRGALGIREPLPEEAWRQQPRDVSDELVATLGACLAAVRIATLVELAEATGASISDVRRALRRLAEQLEPVGMQVLDDGAHVQLAPEKRFHQAVAQLVQPERLPRLSQEQAEVRGAVAPLSDVTDTVKLINNRTNGLRVISARNKWVRSLPTKGNEYTRPGH